MQDHASYAPDILIALVSTATFGGWGLAGAVTISLARHSPVVRDGVAQLAPHLEDLRQRLPELMSDAMQPRALVRRPAAQNEAPGAPALAPQQPAPRPRWLEALNDHPDQHPHALILGPTGAGKTTLATAVMADRGGRSVVLSPKVSAGGWRGAEVISLDDDGSYAPIHAAMADLEDEKRRRIVTLRQRGRDALEPMTVVLDEIQELTAKAPEAGEFMVSMSSIGREIKMRVIGVGTTDDALNVRGWKASRPNYARVVMTPDRRAALSDGTRTIQIAPREAPALARAAQLRPWRGEVEEPAAPPARRTVAADAPRAEVVSVRVPAPITTPDALLASLMAELPADVRAMVPDVSPERAQRLAEILRRQQSVTVARDGGGDVHVHVQQVSAQAAPAPVTGRSPRRGGAGLNARKMRERANKYRKVEAAILAGKSGNEAQAEAQVKREVAQQIARQVRARHGLAGGSRKAVPGSGNRDGAGTSSGSEAS